MLERNKTTALKESAASASEFAASLAMDKKFRKELLSAISHGTLAQKRAARKIGFYAAMLRLKQDPMLRRELNRMMSSLDKAWSRVEKKRSHKLRNTVLVLGTAGGVAAIVVKTNLHKKLPGVGTGTSARAIDAWTEVRVPVSVAYNQWTQFEDFPLFMEGVDHVQQLDDTRLHWVANVAGKQAEWDAKIIEQHPDRQISWISEDGKKTRGTVSFEPRGDDKTLVHLSMSYWAEGTAEQLGSAAGLDKRRISGDLERFRELIEARGAETGAWRGEVEAGQTKS
jgi:uncharacterized membrane protein